MRKLFMIVMAIAMLTVVTGEGALAAGKHGPAAAAKKVGKSSSQSGGAVLEAQLVPATGGIATSVVEATLEIGGGGGQQGQDDFTAQGTGPTVALTIQGLAGAGAPITNTGSLEIDLIVNGNPTSPAIFPVPVVNGNASVTGVLPVNPGDKVEIPGFRILDSLSAPLLHPGFTAQATGTSFEVEGQVSNLAGTCPNMTFTVDGLAVMTDANTVYEDGTCSSVANGVPVQVKGVVLPNNGGNLATKVEFEDDQGQQQ